MHDHSTPSLRSPRVYRFVIGITLVAAGLSLFTDPAQMGLVELAVLFGAVLLLGIPHGAIDHLVASEVYGLDATVKDQAKFYVFYLLMMLIYGALWVVFPVACLLLFLMFAIYHFGQSDLEYLGLPAPDRYALYVSRGVLLIGLPIVAHLEVVSPIFVQIAGLDLLGYPWLADHATAWTAGVVLQHVMITGGLAVRHRIKRAAVGRETLNIALLTALFLVANPLVAFAIYFGFWHSLGHILELVRYFNRQGEPMSVWSFYRKAAAFTVMSVVGLLMLYALNSAFGLEEHMISLLFILIAVLTLPHMVIVERFYQDKKVSLSTTG